MSALAVRSGRPHSASSRPGLPTGPPGTPRILLGTGSRAPTFDEHLRHWGPLPVWQGAEFIDEVDRSGLRGRGGAWFPVATKWRAVQAAGRRAPVVVANGAEGEPASGKDRLLIHRQPHLVLDGAAVAATALGACRIVVHVTAAGVAPMTDAIAERRSREVDPCPVDVAVAPDRFLAGQESAVVSALNGARPATPTFVGLRPVRESGIGGRPTLVQNVETLAHVALIARFGSPWFRGVGSTGSPGTTLLTVTGRWPDPRIVEATLGTPLGQVLGITGHDTPSIQGVLVGGYGGGWITAAEAVSTPLTEEALRAIGSSIGAGVVALLPAGVCPLAEVAEVTRYLQGEGAGQCGPCVNGLAAIATTVEQLAFRPEMLRSGVGVLPTLCGLVEGRGACRHPDGVARFVRTALRVFGSHVDHHLRRGPCAPGPGVLPLPLTQAPRR
jgi:NADH:ubiquinone oxidoreductase subunit F (NADH-binding)